MNSYLQVTTISAVIISLYSSFGTPISQEERLRLDGGPYQLRGKGWIAAIDSRTNPNPDDYAEGLAKIEFDLATVVSNRIGSAFSLFNAKEQVRASGGNVAVFIIDDISMPMTLSAPEDRWAMVNAAKLKTDNPTEQKFQHRLSLMFTRQCCRALGSDEGPDGDTCFRTVFTASDVDKIESIDITYSATTQILATMPLRGMEAIDWGSYRDACSLGIAPPPTNDIQKKVWDEVHEIPLEPIKIKFEKK